MLTQLRGADIAHTAGQHNRFMKASEPKAIRICLFESPEVAADIRTTELVVEGRPTQRALEHNLEG